MTSSKWLHQLISRLIYNRHRELLVIQGEQDYQQMWLDLILQSYSKLTSDLQIIEVVSQLTTSPFRQVLESQLPKMLGQEVDLAIFHSKQGLTPNSLAQASGMIKAGGLCVICLDDDWLTSHNLAMEKYLSYPLTLSSGLNGFRLFLDEKFNHHSIKIQQNKPLPKLTEIKIINASKNINQYRFEPTKEQLSGIDLIHSVSFGHRNRPLLLTADRGRGKSTTLGFAAIELFRQGKNHIAITAATPTQVTQILIQAEKFVVNYQDIELFEKVPGGGRFKVLDKGTSSERICTLQFYAPDELIQNKKIFDILFVEEAAHLPITILEQFTKLYSRIVFATTESGYEGSGMGFKLTFSKILSQFSYKKIKLIEPIRWNVNDPLEEAINNCLFLNHSAKGLNKKVAVRNLTYRQINLTKLALQSELIANIFSLLSHAHYQTSPNNLMQLLEDPSLILWTAFDQDNCPVGILVAFKEGSIKEIVEKKRYQGHLVAQLLTKQTQEQYWLNASSYRINRIAVQPNSQGQGIGTNLVDNFIASIKKQSQVDYLSVSFAATKSLINFWDKQGFVPAYLGIKKDKASARHSLTMLYGLNNVSQEKINKYLLVYSLEFGYLLQATFKELNYRVVLKLLGILRYEPQIFPSGYLNSQVFETTSYRLQKWSLANPEKIAKLPNNLTEIWVKKVLQGRSWNHLVKQHKQTSRKQIEERFKAANFRDLR